MRLTPGFCSHAINFAKFHKCPWRWPPEKACWPLRCKYIRYREIHLLSWEELDTISLSHTCQTVAVGLCIRGWDGHSGPAHLKHFTEHALSTVTAKDRSRPIVQLKILLALGRLAREFCPLVCLQDGADDGGEFCYASGKNLAEMDVSLGRLILLKKVLMISQNFPIICKGFFYKDFPI